VTNVEIDDVDPNGLRDYLSDNHRIIVVSISHPEFQGIRVRSRRRRIVAFLRAG